MLRTVLLACILVVGAGCVHASELYVPFRDDGDDLPEAPVDDSVTHAMITRGNGSPVGNADAAGAWSSILRQVRGHLSAADARSIERAAVRWYAAYLADGGDSRPRACSRMKIPRRRFQGCLRPLGLNRAVLAAFHALERGSADPAPMRSFLRSFPEPPPSRRACAATDDDEAVSAVLEHELLMTSDPVPVVLDRPRCIHARNTGRPLQIQQTANRGGHIGVFNVRRALRPDERAPMFGDREFDDAPLVVVSWVAYGAPLAATFYDSYLRKVRGRWRVVGRVVKGAS